MAELLLCLALFLGLVACLSRTERPLANLRPVIGAEHSPPDLRARESTVIVDRYRRRPVPVIGRQDCGNQSYQILQMVLGVVVPGMVRLVQHFKVLWAIVLSVAVYVVDFLPRLQLYAVRLFIDEPMFASVAICICGPVLRGSNPYVAAVRRTHMQYLIGRFNRF